MYIGLVFQNKLTKMESFNENMIYIKEEDCAKDINVTEDFGYKEYDNGENYENKILKMENCEESKIKQDLNIKIESISGEKKEAEYNADDDIMEQAGHKITDVKEEVNDGDVNIKEEELDFMEFDTSNEEPLGENNPLSFKSKNISQIRNYIKQPKSSDDIVDFSDGTIYQESFSTNSNSYECSEGAMKTSRSSERNFNIKSKSHSRKLYHCTKCNFSTFHKLQIENHIKSHEGESFNEKCQASTSKSDMKDVSKIDLVSDNSTIKNNGTKGPISQIHTTKSKKDSLKCDFCDYCSSCKSQLRDHIRIHTGEKPFKCDICDYRTSFKQNIRTHKRIHTGERPFKCNDCDYAASQKSILQNHVRIHTGESLYKCGFCDYRAALRSVVQTHSRIHSGDKPVK